MHVISKCHNYQHHTVIKTAYLKRRVSGDLNGGSKLVGDGKRTDSSPVGPISPAQDTALCSNLIDSLLMVNCTRNFMFGRKISDSLTINKAKQKSYTWHMYMSIIYMAYVCLSY